MPTLPIVALFQGGPLDGQVVAVAGAEEWYCPVHVRPVPSELAPIVAAQPAGACLAYRRHLAAPCRVVYRFDARREQPVTEACRGLAAGDGGER